jgi:DNA-directed RNA polymerase II subunit RPB2
MTIGHVLECLTAKVAAIFGRFSEDATAFREFNVEQKADCLHSKGYQRYGNEFMMNPFSGKSFDNLVYVGPIYYQRLRHMVDDKVYARARGPVVAITRQPTHGRSRGGGLRFGEMERDGVISHGITQFLGERLLKVSDTFKVYACTLCGLLAKASANLNGFSCTSCRNSKVV